MPEMLRPTCALLPLLFIVACKEPAAKDAAPRSASSSSVTVTTASVTTATAPAKDTACAALEWDKEGMDAKPASFTGKVDSGEGSNATGKMEKFETLVLDKPACGPDKAAVSEVQLYTNEKSIDLKKMIGKTVTIEGAPFASHTAHHHRPIVVEVKKLTAK